MSSDELTPIVNVLKLHLWGAMPLKFIRPKDRVFAKEIFNEIRKSSEDKSILLISALLRIKADINIDLHDLINMTVRNELRIVKAATVNLYDSLIFIEKKEMNGLDGEIKDRLISMILYAPDEVFVTSIDSLIQALKYSRKVINKDDYLLLKQFTFKFLDNVQAEKIQIETFQDFESLSQVVKLLVHLNKYYLKDPDATKWSNFIKNNKLPKVRAYESFLD